MVEYARRALRLSFVRAITEDAIIENAASHISHIEAPVVARKSIPKI
jgi:hypothetical protein